MTKFKPGDRVQWIEGQAHKNGSVREISTHAKQLEKQAIQKARPEMQYRGWNVDRASSVVKIKESNSGRLLNKKESEIERAN